MQSQITVQNNYKPRKFSKWRGVFRNLRFAVIFAVLTVPPISASTQVHAEEGRIHITFFKAGHGSGSGYLFYQGQKYGLAIVAPEIGRIWATSIDLIGTASDLHSASDIIGIYTAADAGAAAVRRTKTARLENKKGVVLEIRAVNLNRLFTLNLSGITIENLGWQPSSE
jgi:hypothetical protein